MSVLWPSGLPAKPLIAGSRRTWEDPVLRTAVDVGPKKARRRFTAVSERFMVRYLLTSSELSAFETFYKTTTKYGSLSFEMAHPVSGATVLVRFLTPPQIRPVGLRYEVEYEIEVLP